LVLLTALISAVFFAFLKWPLNPKNEKARESGLFVFEGGDFLSA
jgi:hypothetical protein